MADCPISMASYLPHLSLILPVYHETVDGQQKKGCLFSLGHVAKSPALAHVGRVGYLCLVTAVHTNWKESTDITCYCNGGRGPLLPCTRLCAPFEQETLNQGALRRYCIRPCCGCVQASLCCPSERNSRCLPSSDSMLSLPACSRLEVLPGQLRGRLPRGRAFYAELPLALTNGWAGGDERVFVVAP